MAFDTQIQIRCTKNFKKKFSAYAKKKKSNMSELIINYFEKKLK